MCIKNVCDNCDAVFTNNGNKTDFACVTAEGTEVCRNCLLTATDEFEWKYYQCPTCGLMSGDSLTHPCLLVGLDSERDPF